MRCADARRLAESFLAGELLTETNDQILAHLEMCPGCRTDVDRRRRLRDELRRVFHSTPELASSPELTERLRDRLRNQPAFMPARGRRRLVPAWASAAAACVIAGLGLLWAYQAVFSDTLLAAAVGDHSYCTLPKEEPFTLETAALRQPLYRRLEALAPTATTPSGIDVRIVDRHLCFYGGRQFVHLVLQYRDQRVSLVASTSVNRSLSQFAAARIDGMNVVTFRSASLTLFVVGELQPTDLQAIATLIDKQLRQS
jgi:anti-sigma factor RsiW